MNYWLAVVVAFMSGLAIGRLWFGKERKDVISLEVG
jgi:hypothetical protein